MWSATAWRPSQTHNPTRQHSLSCQLQCLLISIPVHGSLGPAGKNALLRCPRSSPCHRLCADQCSIRNGRRVPACSMYAKHALQYKSHTSNTSSQNKLLTPLAVTGCCLPKPLLHCSNVLRPNAAAAAHDAGTRLHPAQRMLSIRPRQDKAVCKGAGTGCTLAAGESSAGWEGTRLCGLVAVPGLWQRAVACCSASCHATEQATHGVCSLNIGTADAQRGAAVSPKSSGQARQEAAERVSPPASYSSAGSRHALLLELLPLASHSARNRQKAGRQPGAPLLCTSAWVGICAEAI